MPIKITPLTKKQLIDYFHVYRAAFPDWVVEHDVVLTRVHGPLKQNIAFEALRSGAYRPSCGIDILLRIPDGCGILDQFLDVKHRQVLPREHATKWPLVLKAMEEQFMPPIRKPLEVTETLELAEDVVRLNPDNININFSTALAALNAYLGDAQRALYWCDRVAESAANKSRGLADWEARKTKFIRELRQSIEDGKEREFLVAV
jgi:hypothetical protein